MHTGLNLRFASAALLLIFAFAGNGCDSSSTNKDKDTESETASGFHMETSDEGWFSLTHADFGNLQLQELGPAIRIGDTTFRCADYDKRTWETLAGEAGWQLTCSGSSEAPELVLVIERTDDDHVLSLYAKTTGAVADLRGFEVLGSPAGGLQLGSPEVAWLSNGYQSWSPSGVLRVAAKPPAGGLDSQLRLRGKEDESRKGLYLSWWFTAIAAEEGAGLVLGATTANRFKSSFSVYQESSSASEMTLKVMSGLTGESVSAQDGQVIESERYLLMMGDDPWTLLRQYATAFSPSRSGAKAGAMGWNSWYDLYDGVTADDIEANAALAAQKLKGSESFTIVIDDGWEKEWGLWEPNDKFPNGMAPVASAIKAEGLIPGLWLAPLLADDESSLLAEHPDWFVKDSTGSLLTYSHPNGAQSILDVTHPEAAAFIATQVENAVSWGFEMLKLDFLFVGAYEGVRHEPVTGTEAYEITLELLRETMGDEIYFLACGAPLLSGARPLPYDAIRTGADIAFEAFGPSWSFVTTQLRHTASRSFLNGLAFEVDPDPPLVRATKGDAAFTADEAWAMVVSVLVSGGVFFSSDNLTTLADDRLSLLQHDTVATIRQLADPTAQPIGLFTWDDLPDDGLINASTDHVQMSVTHPGGTSSVQPYAYKWLDAGTGAYVALFAFQPEGLTVNLALEELGLDPAASWIATTQGPGPSFSTDDGTLSGTLAGHQAVILHVTEAI